jgi:KaiC/GvpD/RAD55 family RecA-like ATPase
MVVYDGGSLWYNALNTMAAGWLNMGGTFYYNVTAQPVDKLRKHLIRLGLDIDELEKNDKLRFADWYTSTLGQKSKERFSSDSLKVADLSIAFSKFIKDTFGPEVLRVWDSTSYLARYNDEKSLVEFVLSRPISAAYSKQSNLILAFIKGYHSEWVYRALEAAVDGIIDLKLEESGEETRNLIRIRSMRNAAHDARWHRLAVGKNFEVILEK